MSLFFLGLKLKGYQGRLREISYESGVYCTAIGRVRSGLLAQYHWESVLMVLRQRVVAE